MRIIYYSKTFFTDCDFPLIREFQRIGASVWYFFPMDEGNTRQALLDIKQIKGKKGIFRASEYVDLSIYKEYIDLDKVFVINIPSGGADWKNKLFWIYVFIKMLLIRADIFHFTWQLLNREKYLYHLPCKKVMTVHDPISHSSVKDEQDEIERKEAFSHSDGFMLLSNALAKQFSDKFNIPSEKIFFSHMGEFSHLRYVKSKESSYPKPYILYFGQILSYKGIEYLCEAMTIIHEKHPEINLLIAGRGKIYFDYSRYEKLPYIHLKNEYISISDLATMLQGALFSVCPYKDATQSGVVQTSFSANCPVIVTNVGALPESCKDNLYGKVVPPCDAESLARAIDELLSSPSTLEQYRQNINTQWRKSMSWESIAQDYLKAWKNIL